MVSGFSQSSSQSWISDRINWPEQRCWYALCFLKIWTRISPAEFIPLLEIRDWLFNRTLVHARSNNRSPENPDANSWFQSILMYPRCRSQNQIHYRPYQRDGRFIFHLLQLRDRTDSITEKWKGKLWKEIKTGRITVRDSTVSSTSLWWVQETFLWMWKDNYIIKKREANSQAFNQLLFFTIKLPWYSVSGHLS